MAIDSDRKRTATVPLALAILLQTACAGLLAAETRVSVSAPRDYRPLAHEILQELVGIKTTESGVGSTPAAEAIARRLRATGFPESDLHVLGAAPRKMNVVARLPGRGRGKPVLIIGHLDVVEARKEDWSPDLDPFVLTERDGYFYGRGTQDMKQSAAIFLTNFIRWKEEGWVPGRDLVLALTADEEEYGDENGVAWLLKNRRDLVDAEYCVNLDGGDLQTRDGKPYLVTVAAGEKKETILQLQTRNPGGHGSVPRPDNAIYELVAALAKIEALRFPPMLNEVTRAEFAAMATLESGQRAEDMKAVSHDPPDEAAVERLSRDPYYNALLRTTCVSTMLDAGHGPSALPQRATALLNCRIVPGHTSAELLEGLRRTIADDRVEIAWRFNEPSDPPASPLRPEIFSAVQRVKERLWPGVVVMPGMETGATDARFLRAAGIPTYGVSGAFIEQGDLRAHGKDERIRVRDFYDGVEFYDRFMKALVAEQQAPSRPRSGAQARGCLR
jgi:acetylornithine deacetylase/succinyl-diaminopimelate desuccinylase-like protein